MGPRTVGRHVSVRGRRRRGERRGLVRWGRNGREAADLVASHYVYVYMFRLLTRLASLVSSARWGFVNSCVSLLYFGHLLFPYYILDINLPVTVMSVSYLFSPPSWK